MLAACCSSVPACAIASSCERVCRGVRMHANATLPMLLRIELRETRAHSSGVCDYII